MEYLPRYSFGGVRFILSLALDASGGLLKQERDEENFLENRVEMALAESMGPSPSDADEYVHVGVFGDCICGMVNLGYEGVLLNVGQGAYAVVVS